jgi:heat shock protein HtpX
MTRILLFLATNLGIDFPRMQLLVFATVFGFGGSFISLAMSKWVAKRATGARIIEEPSNDAERWLVETVRQQAQAANIGMPEVAIFPSDSPNAFATGARKDKALVAVSTGLLAGMQRDEIEAVLGHEVSHVANGDMVTLTLIQGILNVFVLFFSRIIGEFVDSLLSRGGARRGFGIGYWVSTIFAQIVLTAVASLVVCWFSRHREFRADAGGARLAGSTAMVNALKRLKSLQERSEELPEQVAAFGISGGNAWMRLYSTHPPLEQRIAALESRAHA